MKSILPAMLLVAAATLPDNSLADDAAANAARMAEEVTREYDLLAPSLQKAAEELVVEVKAFHAGHKPAPAIEWKEEFAKPKVFVTPKGERTSEYTELLCKSTISELAYRYRLKRIVKIARTGIRERPFAGTVEFEIDTSIKSIHTTLTEPNPFLPKSYRPYKPPAGTVFMLAAPAEPEILLEHEAAVPRYPLPVGPTSRQVMKTAPKVLTKAKQKLIDQCRKAKPVQERSIKTVVFHYCLADHEWHWPNPSQKAKR